MSDHDFDRPVLQIVGIPRNPHVSDNRVGISDGKYYSISAYFAQQLSHYLIDKIIHKYTIIRLDKYEVVQGILQS